MRKRQPSVATLERQQEISAQAVLASRGSHDADVTSFYPPVIVGRIAAIRDDREPLVDFPVNTSRELVPARTTCRVTAEDVGREVVLVFDEGDPTKPIIIGVITQPAAAPVVGRKPVDLQVDQDRLLLTAKEQIVLRCGKSCITLTAAGKVLITGEYLLSRSSGVNRIKGGSVQIN